MHAETLNQEAASDLVNMTHIQDDITKFKMQFAYYQGLKEESDALCQRFQLMIIEEPKNNSLHYAEWKAEKE